MVLLLLVHHLVLWMLWKIRCWLFHYSWFWRRRWKWRCCCQRSTRKLVILRWSRIFADSGGKCMRVVYNDAEVREGFKADDLSPYDEDRDCSVQCRNQTFLLKKHSLSLIFLIRNSFVNAKNKQFSFVKLQIIVVPVPLKCLRMIGW